MTDHEELVRSYYERVDAEDYEGVFALFAEDVVYDRPGQEPIAGMADFREFYLTGRPLEDGEHTIDDVVVEGDVAAVRGEFSGVQDGDRVAFGFADFHEFDDAGQIARRFTYTDRDEV
ncbi:MAG: nuclear transport factor 2 family protein [Halanaeroarchaeum sp.]